jgi:hypothetical protein
MDPISALQEILNQIVELGGAGLELIAQAAGGGGGGEQPPAEAAPPAPPQ